jgi:hypothetical protein
MKGRPRVNERASPARVAELLSYEPETGLLRRRVFCGGELAGSVAGSIMKRANGRSYISISIDGARYLAHILAWVLMTGEWPPLEIDHRDRDGLNNRPDNLRLATSTQNSANSKRQSNNTSGRKGVFFYKRTGKWKAFIGHTHLGYYDSLALAEVARAAAEQKQYGEFTRVE